MTPDDLLLLKERFASYCRSFYCTDSEDQKNILLKEEHTHKVCDDIRSIGLGEGLSAADLLLAEATALFHDIGRFPQYAEYRTYKDSQSVNHGRLGAEVLVREKILDGVRQDEQEIILHAVRFHNAFIVPEHPAGRHRQFLQLVRDADKLDIWRVFLSYYEIDAAERPSTITLGLPDLAGVSPGIFECIQQKKVYSLSLMKSQNDFKLLQMSWVFDLNYPTSFALACERGYIHRLGATVSGDDRISEAVKIITEFAESRVSDAGATAV